MAVPGASQGAIARRPRYAKLKSVGLDAFNISRAQGSGIATYARNLNRALRDMGVNTQLLYGPANVHRDPILRQIALFDAAVPSARGQSRARIAIDTITSPLGRRAVPAASDGTVITRHIAQIAPETDGLWACRDIFHSANRAFAATHLFTPLTFGRDAAIAAPDVMHWTTPLPLRARHQPNVYTIHDLVPLRLPFTTLDNKRNFLKLCREIVRTADAIATVSQTSKADIVRILGVDEARVIVTYQAVTPPKCLATQSDAALAAQLEATFGLGWQDYFLFFGAVEPKKNLTRIIEAYLSSGAKGPLVIVGPNGWLLDEQMTLLYPDLVERRIVEDASCRRQDRVRRYEYLPASLLAPLICGAKAVVTPFIYEGFGLPILESMQIGTPVIAADVGAACEVAGDAALLVDPYDVDAIRIAIRDLDSDADLRATLSNRGIRRAERFNHAAYHQRLGELYAPFL